MSQSSFVKGTIILTIATLTSKVLGSVFRIPLQNIAGDEVLGIFNLVYPVYMVALILSVAGLPLAISKLISEARAKEDNSSIRDIYLAASILAVLFGIVSFTLIFSYSNEIANMLGGESTRLALIIVASTLLFAPYMAIYRGYFQGFEEMKQTAISQVIEQFVRAVLIIGIAYFLVQQNYTDEKIAGGIMVGSVVGVLVALLFLRISYKRSSLQITPSDTFSLKRFIKSCKKILSISIPIAVGSITMALFNAVDSFTVSYALRSIGISTDAVNYWFGIYSRGLTLVQIATVFATSIVLPIVPLISSKLAKKDIKGTRLIIERTHEMTHIISWPVATGLLALTLPLNLALFTNLEGSTMLAIIGFSSIFTSLTLIGTGVLQGINLAKTAASIIIGGVFLKIVTNILFIKLFGLDGAAISTLLVYFIIFIANTIVIWKNIKISVFQMNKIKVILASILVGILIGLPSWMINFSEWNRLLALFYIFIASLLGVAIYLSVLLLLKVIDTNSIKELLTKSIGKGEF
ncbi:putative polysaccharide biosynthesis protein [Paucisalibacillus globulus]|uniref:putative polysaccharide biosynthesis protein n=1 Tax=Paucisalibacillus globulus TaxID=351095 RepID=UPI00041B09CC|nr:polysaccharide biosynthesis protein [Paucisalibacillus globulus]